jgi:hypothetical protein
MYDAYGSLTWPGETVVTALVVVVVEVPVVLVPAVPVPVVGVMPVPVPVLPVAFVADTVICALKL